MTQPHAVTTDYFSNAGASALAETITTYWHSRGYPWVEAERFPIAERPSMWGVRSNLVDGLPPTRRPGRTLKERRMEFLR
jgi:hypothetical protein